MSKRPLPTETILQVSFFWKNDQPNGIGMSFGPPSFNSAELQNMFNGDTLKDFLRNSDQALGTKLVEHYLAQLSSIGKLHAMGHPLPIQHGILAALNIIWLVERGFLANDEFNGYQFVTQPP